MKTTTLEVIIPDWAKWIAQWDTGEWWAYENEPYQIDGRWSWKWTDCCSRSRPIADGVPNPNWRETSMRVE